MIESVPCQHEWTRIGHWDGHTVDSRIKVWGNIDQCIFCSTEEYFLGSSAPSTMGEEVELAGAATLTKA